jgi:hypothetical protein
VKKKELDQMKRHCGQLTWNDEIQDEADNCHLFSKFGYISDELPDFLVLIIDLNYPVP